MRKFHSTRIMNLAAAGAILAFAVAGVANAQLSIFTVPTDLAPGEQYRLAFVSSTTRDASSTNIADYDAHVAAAAAAVPGLAALGTTWQVIGSTPGLNARDHTGTAAGAGSTVPIYLLNDTRLANDGTDLWDGSIQVPLNITESGGTSAVTSVWTGTLDDGTVGSPSPLGASFVWTGVTSQTAINWIENNNATNVGVNELYAISDVLTVPPAVPALSPWGLALLGVSLFGATLWLGKSRTIKA